MNHEHLPENGKITNQLNKSNYVQLNTLFSFPPLCDGYATMAGGAEMEEVQLPLGQV